MPAAKNYTQLEATPDTLTDADFTAGPEDDSQLNAGQVGSIAEAEVGSDGVLQNYQWVAVRQIGNDDPADKPFIDLEAGDSDAADSTLVRFGARKKGSQGINESAVMTEWKPIRNLDASDPRQLPVLRVKGGKGLKGGGDPLSRPVQDGRIIVMQVRNESSQVTVDLSESTINLAIVGWN